MKQETINTLKKNLELLDIKFKSLAAVHTLLTTTMFSASGPYNCQTNESIISMLEFEKKLKSDINGCIRQIQGYLNDSHDKKTRKYRPSYLKAIPGGKKLIGGE